jgi:imidazoleglycerol phosphate dehydratase HisB
MLAGKQKAIHDQRDRKLEEAREDRGEIRAQQAVVRYLKDIRPEDRATLVSNPRQNHHSAESVLKASARGLKAEHPRCPASFFVHSLS